MNWKLVLLSLVLLFLCCEIKGYRIEKREAPTYLEQIQDVARRSWAQVSSTTQNWVEAAKSIEIEKKIKEAYDKSIGPYMDIISDQLYHLWFVQ